VELHERREEGAPRGATARQHSALSTQRSWLDDRFAGTSATSPRSREAGTSATSPRSREVQNGFGDGLAKAFELVLTPTIFGLAGFGLDRWLGLTPLFTIVLTVWALIVVSYMTWFRYEAEMRRVEEGAVWARTRRESL
jgi:Flp pilus assembly protein TadB